ncbi:hypothetical protein JCM10213_009017 [Rhodosporidiobolus nylandii]
MKRTRSGASSDGAGAAASGSGAPRGKRRASVSRSGTGRGSTSGAADIQREDLAATATEDGSDEEPDTEVDETEVVVEAGPSSSAGSRAARAEVLDLTDEGDGTRSSPVATVSSSAHFRRPIPINQPQGGSLFDSITVADDSDEDAKPRQKKDKGKGKARASSSPPPSAGAGESTSTPPSSAVPLGPDGEPLRTLNHLTCPICFGAPAPLALTSCGHAFCAPCLHASLVAGPALTPPPAGSAAARRGAAGGRGGYTAAAQSGMFRGGRATVGRGRGGSMVGGAGGGEADDDGDPELDKHCPVCRTPLYGGWGKSLRGLVLRMGPAKRKEAA